MGFCLPVKCPINLSFMLMSLGTISETDKQKDSVNVFVLMYHSIYPFIDTKPEMCSFNSYNTRYYLAI